MTASNDPTTHRNPSVSVLLAIVLSGLFLFGCKVGQEDRVVRLPGSKKAYLLDTTQAKAAIVEDDIEHFFELITPVDISIQTKTAIAEDIDRTVLIDQYKSFLQSEVMDFTYEEAMVVTSVMKQAGRLVNKISADLLPKNLYLIKVKGQQYGPKVYYTRKNCIVIPAPELKHPNKAVLLQVMLHELFHIYSRYHPDKKHALYELIGFRPLPVPSSALHIPDNLRQSVLLNPDGINFAYAIELEDKEGRSHTCIPIISSNFHQFSSRINDHYLSYLSFNLYPIKEGADSSYTVITAADGSSPLKLWDIRESFHEQIGSGTSYIIHPDEILADKFALMILRKTPGTPESQRFGNTLPLLQEMETIIRSEP